MGECMGLNVGAGSGKANVKAGSITLNSRYSSKLNIVVDLGFQPAAVVVVRTFSGTNYDTTLVTPNCHAALAPSGTAWYVYPKIENGAFVITDDGPHDYTNYPITISYVAIG